MILFRTTVPYAIAAARSGNGPCPITIFDYRRRLQVARKSLPTRLRLRRWQKIEHARVGAAFDQFYIILVRVGFLGMVAVIDVGWVYSNTLSPSARVPYSPSKIKFGVSKTNSSPFKIVPKSYVTPYVGSATPLAAQKPASISGLQRKKTNLYPHLAELGAFVLLLGLLQGRRSSRTLGNFLLILANAGGLAKQAEGIIRHGTQQRRYACVIKIKISTKTPPPKKKIEVRNPQ